MARSSAQARAQRKEAKEKARAKAQRKKRLQTAAWVGAVAAIIVVVAVATWPEPEVGSVQAESWDLPALDGDERIALDDFAGKPTVAAFFASWCHVCEEELPQFNALSQEIGDDINFVGINSQDNGRGGGDAAKWGIDQQWPIARDIGGTNGSGLSVGTFGARGMPLTVLYSAEGQVAHVQRGGISAQQLLDLLEQLFGYGA